MLIECGELIALTQGLVAQNDGDLVEVSAIAPADPKEYMLFMYLGTSANPDEMNLDNLLMCLGYVKQTAE